MLNVKVSNKALRKVQPQIMVEVNKWSLQRLTFDIENFAVTRHAT